MIIDMDLENKFLNVEILIKVHLKIIANMETGNIFGINNHGKDIFILVNIKMIKNKELVFIIMHLEKIILDIGKMVKKKDQEFLP